MTRSEWAAWAQAIGAILAILIALAVPAWQHRYRSKQEAQQARLKKRSMALAILGDLDEIQRVVGDFLDYVDLDTLKIDSPSLDVLTKIPATLNAATRQLHELGDAADKVTAVIASLAIARNKMRQARESIYAKQHPDDAVEEILAHLRDVRDRARVALGDLLIEFK